MTAPFRVGEDPLDALKAMKAQRAPTAGHASDDPLEQLKAMTAPGGHDIHREYASGRLAGRMARENANEAEAAASDGADSRLGAFGQSVAATGATIAQGIPGMRRLQAYTGMAASHVMGDHPLSYQQSLDALDSATGKIPGALSVAERAAGGAPLAMLLPGSAAASGAMVGAADQALSADPQSLMSRGLRTAAGAAGGALVGKLGEKLVTGAKALLPSRLGGVGEGADAALIRMQGERAQSAATLYAQAIAEGKGGAIAPHIHDFLAEDDIAPIVAKIRGGRTGATMDTPELLDRVYKELSDMQRAAARPLAGVDPSKPNAAVSQLANIKAAKQKFLNVVSRPGQKPPITMDVAPEVYDVPSTVLQPERATMDGPVGTGPLSARTSPANPTLSQGLRNFHGETPNAVQGPDGPAFQMRGQAERVRPGARIETPAMRVQTAPAEDVPPLMPSYQQAVEDYAKRTQDIQALKRGYAALKQNGTGDLPAVNALGRKTPLALADWAKGASPEEIAAARRGVLGGVRDATALGGTTLRRGRQYTAAAAPLLRKLETPGQDFTEALQNLGLLTTGNTLTRP